ncbi:MULTISPECIES: very short patch repair endonuclease [Bacillus]|uniref:very short patch repair endonuclease n=1 Tax=Bacillus TaxID=1386 RepID=UPI000BA4306F|nr:MULTISPECIES: very short patch repair endonuclease [Bacillus]AYV16879.1 very short patch repair endonuclease [Bacillus velezensis]MBY0034268.1 very short patch repair endonuclease [Bacillus velezensis]MBY0042232.1 very short patch repair endonuclease [Bacillus velezensis]MCY1637707.1 very short patch repair endonuclease [Bacillus sp. SL112]MEC2019376.1 very short patch repair endonuclease [Bacillus velezensis]
MSDRHTDIQRKRNMQAVKSVSKLEDKVASELWRRGLRFRRNVKSLYGKPDIAIKKYKTVIFIDSCFWHFCEMHGSIPKTNSDFWESKLKRNQQRDFEVTSYYVENNWNILRVWEHELKIDFYGSIGKIERFIRVAVKTFM